MLRILGAIVLLEWCLLAPSSGNPSQRRDFLVEVTPARATFFTGDDIEITALSAAEMSIGPSYVFELVQAGKVVSRTRVWWRRIGAPNAMGGCSVPRRSSSS